MVARLFMEMNPMVTKQENITQTKKHPSKSTWYLLLDASFTLPRMDIQITCHNEGYDIFY